jgi:hypothetical protein
MSLLPRVTELTRERVYRQMDDLGPVACTEDVIGRLRRENPEILDIARKCAADVGDAARAMTGLGMFYALLLAETPASARLLHPLPRVTGDTRDAIVREIDASGVEAFTNAAINEMERTNPELLQTAHDLASAHRDYVGMLVGFALVYRCLVVQSMADRATAH